MDAVLAVQAYVCAGGIEPNLRKKREGWGTTAS